MKKPLSKLSTNKIFEEWSKLFIKYRQEGMLPNAERAKFITLKNELGRRTAKGEKIKFTK